jgi:hypothetical protein
MYIVIARTLRANDSVGGRTVAVALVALQLLVATNHAVAAIQSHASSASWTAKCSIATSVPTR